MRTDRKEGGETPQNAEKRKGKRPKKRGGQHPKRERGNAPKQTKKERGNAPNAAQAPTPFTDKKPVQSPFE